MIALVYTFWFLLTVFASIIAICAGAGVLAIFRRLEAMCLALHIEELVKLIEKEEEKRRVAALKKRWGVES